MHDFLEMKSRQNFNQDTFISIYDIHNDYFKDNKDLIFYVFYDYYGSLLSHSFDFKNVYSYFKLKLKTYDNFDIEMFKSEYIILKDVVINDWTHYRDHTLTLSSYLEPREISNKSVYLKLDKKIFYYLK